MKNTIGIKCIAFFVIAVLMIHSVGQMPKAQAEEIAKPIHIIVMGREVSFPDQQPVFINSRTMVPVRLTEEFDFNVNWQASINEVVVSNAKTVVIFKIGSDLMTVNGISQKMDVKAQTLNNRTMIPLRYLTEPFGYDVKFENNPNDFTISLVLKESDEDAAQKKLMEKMGLTDTLYPIYDDVGISFVLMRIEEAVARGSGQGVDILVVDSEQNADKSMLTKLAPSAKLDMVTSLPENLDGYDIVSIKRNLWKNYDMDQLALKYPDTLFLVTIDYYTEAPRDKPVIDNSAHFEAVKKLTQPNIIKVGRGMFNAGSINPWNILYDYAPVADLYIMDWNDQALNVAAGVFAIFLETHKDMKAMNMKSYIARHSKENTSLVQPREDLNKRIPVSFMVLDAHLLFNSYDDDPAILDVLNLSSYTGKGVKVAIIDHNFDLKGLEDKVKAQYVVSEDKNFGYQNFYGKGAYSHGKEMLNDLLDVAPDAAVYTILTGPFNGTFEGQDAQDIVNALYKAKELNVDVVSMSFAAYYNTNDSIKKAIRSLCDSGILVSWFWSAETLDNQFRSRSGSWEETALGPDGVLMYDRYDKDYYRTPSEVGSVSGTAPRMAGILAQILEADPDATGKAIKQLINETGVKVGDKYMQGYDTIPNVSRLINILDNKLDVVKDLYQNAPIQVSFTKSYDVRINGVMKENTSALSVPGSGHFTIQIQDGGQTIVEPATQQVSVLLLVDSAGNYFLDATFNGTIQTDIGSIEVKKGINKIEKVVGSIHDIQINY
ncbi:hypothetical protein IZU99_06570 [Oscillospiraceae bacterium CM]|nr:hypothetical protein IZU99_06570 [Oscillospiraceae bacterium CM]